MAGADGLVNHTLQGLAQGVSEQTTEARRETQVEEMINCIPHISRGILRRNPVDYINILKDKDGIQIPTEDFYVYTYDRGTASEQYLVLVGHRKWYIFNSNTGVLVGSYNDATNALTNLDYLDTNGLHPKDVFSLVTVGDHTWLSNNQIVTAMDTQTDGLSSTFHKSIAIHTIKSTGNVVTASNPSTGAVTLAGYTYTLKANYNDDAFVHKLDSASITGDNSNKTGSEIAANMITQLNVSHVGTTTAARTEGPFYTWGWYSATYAVIKTGTTYKYYWNGILVGTGPSTSFVSGIYTYNVSGAKKATVYTNEYYAITRTRQEVTSSDPLHGLWKVAGPVIYKADIPESATIEYTDSFGNSASYGFKGVVPSSDKLPDALPKDIGDVLVKVDASDDAEGGEYWLKWNGETWIEDRAPGLTNTIDHTKMPHAFLRADNGTFSFGFYGQFDGTTDTGVHNQPNASRWDDRLKGDEDSAPAPGFIGKKINDMFVHNNRLGFLAEDAVVLSELAEYGNFFPTTVRTIPATDPIDLVVATTDVTGLKKAVSLSGLLLLFSDDSQFALTSGNTGALTPETALISSVSSYNYSNKAPAKVVGNKVYFTTESGNGTQQFAFAVEAISGGAGNITADASSLHVPTYLPQNISYLQGHSILGYLFMLSQDDPTSLYILNTLDIGGQTAQNAYHKWTFDKSIEGISIIGNTLNLVFKDISGLSYASVSLDLPASHNDVVYTDDYDGTRNTSYLSRIVLSKWLIKDGNGVGTLRGRLQMRTALFTTERLDRFKVTIVNDSLFYIPPTDEAWILTDGTWNDSNWWSYNETNTDDSTVVWQDALPFFERIYYNDNKVTVSSNSANTFIIFDSNDQYPSKGFALSTVNYEGLFRQRSQRF